MELEEFRSIEWQEFKKLPCFQYLLEDMAERDAIVLKALKKGDHSMGSDDILRGRLDELEFIMTSVDSYIEALELLENAEKTNKLNKEDEENEDGT